MRARVALAAAASFALLAGPLAAQPPLPPADRARIAEAYRLAQVAGDSIWPGWSRTPFAILLVTPDHEFLIGHPRPSADFTRSARDSVLGEVLVRPRQFSPNLLATFPAVGGLSTIVVGQPERTGKSSTEWVLTLFHEHFHQWQTAMPDYYGRALALGLSGGDSTGMWMLNYPFPYEDRALQEEVDAVGRSIVPAFLSQSREGRLRALARYREADNSLRQALSAADANYLDFQLWQEGAARYTELAVARLAARAHEPTADMRALPDFKSYDAVATALLDNILQSAGQPALAVNKRVAFYPLGAMQALLLDETDRTWRARYLARPFALPRVPVSGRRR